MLLIHPTGKVYPVCARTPSDLAFSEADQVKVLRSLLRHSLLTTVPWVYLYIHIYLYPFKYEDTHNLDINIDTFILIWIWITVWLTFSEYSLSCISFLVNNYYILYLLHSCYFLNIHFCNLIITFIALFFKSITFLGMTYFLLRESLNFVIKFTFYLLFSFVCSLRKMPTNIINI